MFRAQDSSFNTRAKANLSCQRIIKCEGIKCTIFVCCRDVGRARDSVRTLTFEFWFWPLLAVWTWEIWVILSRPLYLHRQMGRIKCPPHRLVMSINFVNAYGTTSLLSSAE